MTMEDRLREVAQPVFLIGPEGKQAVVDPSYGALIVMDFSQWYGVRGELFSASYKTPDAAPIADNANLDILVSTSANLSPHISFQSACGGDSEVLFYEQPTVTSNGTQLAISTVNRVHSQASETLVFRDPTVTNVGNLLFNAFNPGGVGVAAIGGVQETPVDWILRTGTLYLLRVTNRSGGAEQASWVVTWYER